MKYQQIRTIRSNKLLRTIHDMHSKIQVKAGATRGAGTADISGADTFTPGF
jgi:hypothetical protein